MSRQSRIDAPGALHHIIIRGIERRVIFRNNGDRDAFLDRFGELLLGKRKRDWQGREYVLGYFGQTEREAKREYLSFVLKGIDEGRKPELVGGGLLRCVGGWKGLKETRESGQRVKSDERILGRSEFVERVLREAGEQWERRSRLRRRREDLRWLIEKVAVDFGVDTEDLKSGSRSRKVGKARAALCYIAVRELGLSCAFVAKELRISPSAVSKSAVRGRGEWDHAVIKGLLESP